MPNLFELARMTTEFRELTSASCSSLGGQITPFASRTFQYTKEQLGQAEDKVRARFK